MALQEAVERAKTLAPAIVITDKSTNPNECFHSVRIWVHQKNVRKNNQFQALSYISALKFNEGTEGTLKFFARYLPFEIPRKLLYQAISKDNARMIKSDWFDWNKVEIKKRAEKRKVERKEIEQENKPNRIATYGMQQDLEQLTVKQVEELKGAVLNEIWNVTCQKLEGLKKTVKKNYKIERLLFIKTHGEGAARSNHSDWFK